MENLYDNLNLVRTLDVDQYTSDTTGQNNFDSKGARGDCIAIISVGDLNDTGDETYEIKIEEDADSGFSNPTEVKTKTLDRANDDNGIFVIDLNGIEVDRERYLRAKLTVTGSTPEADVGVLFACLQGQNPVR